VVQAIADVGYCLGWGSPCAIPCLRKRAGLGPTATLTSIAVSVSALEQGEVTRGAKRYLITGGEGSW